MKPKENPQKDFEGFQGGKFVRRLTAIAHHCRVRCSGGERCRKPL